MYGISIYLCIAYVYVYICIHDHASSTLYLYLIYIQCCVIRTLPAKQLIQNTYNVKLLTIRSLIRFTNAALGHYTTKILINSQTY